LFTTGNLMLTGPGTMGPESATSLVDELLTDDPPEAEVVPDAALGVKVCDFGLARLQDATLHHTQSGDQLGTPSYMAPEQATGDMRQQDARTDVYGLGAVLYACLTGRPPFQAATPMETLLQAQRHDPVPVRTLVPEVARALEAVCLKCLEKEPGRRYASAGELADDLGRWLTGELSGRLCEPSRPGLTTAEPFPFTWMAPFVTPGEPACEVVQFRFPESWVRARILGGARDPRGAR
jgi:serine/threonine protein kinase